MEELSDCKQHLTFEKGEFIVRENEEITGIFFLSSGVAKVMLNGVHGRPLIIRLAKPGEVFGHRIDARHRVHPVSIVALEKASICFVPLQHFQRFLTNDQSFFQQVIRQYLDNLVEVEQRTLLLAQKNVRQKIAGALLQIANAYQYKNNASGIRIHLERQDIADLASTTKEQVSKNMFDLKNEGLINFRAKHIKYLNLEALQQIVER